MSSLNVKLRRVDEFLYTEGTLVLKQLNLQLTLFWLPGP